MTDRRSVGLDEDNLIAAAQILSWIAWPHRPQDGVNLLCQWFWARRQFRGEVVPDLSFALKKPSRIKPQLNVFREKVLVAFRAAQWFELKVMSGPHRSRMFAGMNVSTRNLGGRRARARGTAQGNEIRDVWSRRKPVAHMACAAATEIAQMHRERGMRGFDLEMTLFDPVWVPGAIVGAESRLRGAILTGAFVQGDFVHFHRDSF